MAVVFDRLIQIWRHDRLPQPSVHARADDGSAAFFVRIAKQTDNRQQLHPLRRHLADGTCCLQPVHPLHFNFHEDATVQIGLVVFFQQLQRGFASGSDFDNCMDILQHTFEIFGLPDVVIDYQNPAFI